MAADPGMTGLGASAATCLMGEREQLRAFTSPSSDHTHPALDCSPSVPTALFPQDKEQNVCGWELGMAWELVGYQICDSISPLAVS